MTDRGFFFSKSSFDSILKESEPTTKPALTKVACTLGPCSRDLDILTRMLEAGMASARIDFSWGAKEYHQETMENLQRAMRHTKLPCAIMLDTEGTEVHIYNKSGGTIDIRKGETVTLTCDTSVMASSTHLPASIQSFEGMDLVPGTRVFVGQYLFTGSETTSAYLTVTEMIDDQTVSCTANDNASLAGLDFIVNFSEVCSPLPILSEKDTEAIRTFGRSAKIHFLSLSHCRTDEDVLVCRQFLDKFGLKSTKILAKIENITALKNFVDILDAADGIIFSRGLIGLDIAAEKIFRVQKYVIDECNKVCKPVIVTRVLDTMTDTPRPTRAEATDVANLVLEGVDCLLLGAETFRGKHPVTTLKLIQDISKQAEETFDSNLFNKEMRDDSIASQGKGDGKLESLAFSAVRAAALLQADLVIVFTVSGRAARVLSKFRPPVVFPKLVSTGLKWTFTGEAEARHLLISRNCVPILADPSLGGITEAHSAHIEGSMLNRAIAYAYNKKWIKLGSKVVVSQHAKKNTDWTFEEAGIVKILSVETEVLDSAIETYNVHSESMQTLKKRMFAHTRTPTFKGIPVNEMPVAIPKRSSHFFASIPEQERGDDGEDDEDEAFEVSDLPQTPDESSLNEVISQPSPVKRRQRIWRWLVWRWRRVYY